MLDPGYGRALKSLRSYRITDDACNAKLYMTKNVDHFPLFHNTFRHIELCNSVISHKQRIRQNFY